MPSLASPGTTLHVTPAYRPRLIGRDDDRRALLDLLIAPDHRLITLAGPGGVGKTSLALEVAREATDRFGDNVVIVELAPIRDSDLIEFEIARALGLDSVIDHTFIDQIAESREGRPTLLVLDNFEHLIDNAPLVAAMVGRCPLLTVLVTSRTRLNVRGELVYNVEALPTASPSGTAESSSSPAVRLFSERCRQIDRSFVVTERNLTEVVDLCQMLGGLPLAIELAAGRIRTLTPKEMLAGPLNQLDLLAGNTRDLPARQQTMRGAITWSVDLLGPAATIALRKLSVFAGGFTLDFASIIAGANLRAIEELVDYHLIHAYTHAAGQRRFSMKEVIRQYAFESLTEEGEERHVRQRHADTFLSAMESLDSLPRYAHFHEQFATLQPEIDNLRIAIDWFLGTDQPEAAARLLRASTSVLWLHPYTEFMAWLERAVAVLPRNGDERIRCDLLRATAFTCAHLGRNAEAIRAITEATRLARNDGDPLRLMNCLLTDGRVHLRDGAYEKAVCSLSGARSIAETADRTDLLAYVLADLGAGEILLGDFVRAEGTLQEALRLHRDAGELGQAAGALHYLAYLAADRGEFGTARTYANEALELLRDVPEHEQLVVRHLQARIELLAGEHATASAIMREVVDRRLVLGDAGWLNMAFAHIAVLAVRTGRPEPAASLFGVAGSKSLHERSQELFDRPVIEAMETSRSNQGELRFDRAYARGRGMAQTQAIEEAHTLLDAVAAPASESTSYNLTRRERDVLALMVDGLTDRQIGVTLFISDETAKKHAQRVRQKLGVHSRSAAVALALREHIV